MQRYSVFTFSANDFDRNYIQTMLDATPCEFYARWVAIVGA